MDEDILGIEEDNSDLNDTQTIQSLVSKQVIINWDSKEEDKILERKKDIFERTNFWLKMKKSKYVPKCSNGPLKLAGKRRSSRASSVKGIDTSLV